MGGGERITIDLANEFAKRGYTVDLIVLQEVGEFQSHVHKNVRVIPMNARRMFLCVPRFAAYMRKEKPEVLLANDEHSQLYSALAKLFSGASTRLVFRIGTMYSRLLEQYKGFKRLRLTFILKQVFPRADGIIAVSHGIADDIASVASLRRERVCTIYNPKSIEEIESQAHEAVTHEWFTNKTLPIIVTVARFRVPKNIELLVRAFARVRKVIPARLVLVGRGRDEDMLRALAKEKGCDDAVLFAGYTDNPHAYVAKSDIFAFTSLWEGMPNAPLDALACGTAVVSSDCASGPREILAPETDYRKRLSSGVEYAKYGVLTAVNDEEALVEALTRLLTDQDLREQYACLGKKRAQDFNTKDIVDQYARAMRV